jgi:hypothetical protein
MLLSRRSLIAACALAGALATSQIALAQSEPLEGPIILTVTGEVSQPNRGGFDPAVDKFFGYNEVEFAKATEFDMQALSNLELQTVKADFPKGEQVYDYEGPLLADVLAAAGASGGMVKMQALDGYAIEVPFQELVDMGAVVALKRDGEAFSIGGFGPTQIVFPRAQRDDLKDMPDDNWIWSIFHINVQ